MSELKQVKASAGSGKTYQLTRRFLSLLDGSVETDRPFVCTTADRQGYIWPEIMAVTFTNKAATEMKERVVQGLKRNALDLAGDEAVCSPETARKALGGILRRYHRLNIRTIDSLLALLLRLFALEFGIRPDFEIVFDEAELFDAIYDHFIAVCETNETENDLLSETFDTLIHTEGHAGFWVQDMIRNRLRELTAFLRDAPESLETDKETIKDLLVEAHADFKHAVDNATTHFADKKLPLGSYFSKFLTACSTVDLFDPVPESATILKESLCDCVLAKGKGKVDEQDEAEYAFLQRKWQQYRSAHTTLAGAYFLAPAIGIAQRLTNGLDELQRQRGMILGSGLAGFVNALLNHGDVVSEAYCRLGSRLHHLLVDEFQDTSLGQWQAITPLAQECLSKGGSLYYVGDVKQAIYGWRGGDSTLFDKVRQQSELAPLVPGTEPENLPDNWRSFTNVVEFNNTFFRNLENIGHAGDLADAFFSEADPDFKHSFADDLVRAFSECAQGIPAKHAKTEGYVRMQRLKGGRGQEVEEQTLEALDALMDDLTARRSYRDIAVLVRSHTHASLVCDLLVQKNIPVITENSLQLDRHPIVRQLAGLLGFLDYPRDDVSFLTFIGGNEVFLAESGLTEAELHDWLIQPQKRPLGVQFRADFPGHWQRLIEPFYNQSGLMTPYDIVQEAVRVYRIQERHPDSELYIRRFLEVIHLAEENGYGSLSGFLEYWTEKSGDEKVPLPETLDAVRIMTIHKSKGLEFPVVIVPFHNWNIRQDRDFIIRQHKGHRLLTPLRKGLGKPYHTSMGRVASEQLNLLYVAWTRAREELYGFFTEKPATSPATIAMNMFLELDDDSVFELGNTPMETCCSEPPTTPQPRDLAASTDQPKLMEWLPRLRVYRHNLDDYFFNELVRGKIAHRAMELLQVTGDDAHDVERATNLALADFPESKALPEEELNDLTEAVCAMATWALSDDRLKTWLTHGMREPEVMTSSGEYKRLDLLYRDEETVIVDFKTGQPSPKNDEQVREYMDILSAMPGNHTPKGFLVYLDLREIREVGRDA